MKRRCSPNETTVLKEESKEEDPLVYDDPNSPHYNKREVKYRPKPVPPDEAARYVCCRMPLDVSMERKRIILNTSGERLLLRKEEWLPGVVLSWCFIEDPPYEGDEEVIIQGFEKWSNVCFVKFRRLKDGDMDAQIRIGFDATDGCWSYVGTSILKKKYAEKRTMNFGCSLYNRLNIVLHEIGHTLGFPHEHQNNKSGIIWNTNAVYDEMNRSQGWDQKTVDHNILRTYEGLNDSEWDPESIMNYEFGPNLILVPEKYRLGIKRPETFSKLDIILARKFYPFPVGVQPISVLPIDENGGIVKLKLIKTEPTIIQLQFKSPPESISVSLLGAKTTINVLLKNGTKIIASGSADKPINQENCSVETSEWFVELTSPSNQNESPVALVIS